MGGAGEGVLKSGAQLPIPGLKGAADFECLSCDTYGLIFRGEEHPAATRVNVVSPEGHPKCT